MSGGLSKKKRSNTAPVAATNKAPDSRLGILRAAAVRSTKLDIKDAEWYGKLTAQEMLIEAKRMKYL